MSTVRTTEAKAVNNMGASSAITDLRSNLRTSSRTVDIKPNTRQKITNVVGCVSPQSNRSRPTAKRADHESRDGARNGSAAAMKNSTRMLSR